MLPLDHKPSANEEKYFAEENMRLTMEMRAHLDAARAEQERVKGVMRCPKCHEEMQEIAHEMVKLDQCPKCNGVWFDAGELEILERRLRSGARGFLDVIFRR
jgi:uncharacterized protein with PIN domain